jgi:hypothetical protein
MGKSFVEVLGWMVIVASLVGLFALGAREGVYYLQLKKEHQWLHEEKVGTLPGGKPLTRKMLFDLMLTELANPQRKVK